MAFKQVTIKNFKNLIDLTINFEDINIIVGSNNSGKSSILQALQFAVSVAQTTSLEKTAYWHHTQDRLPTSISQTQLIYSPLRDVHSLSPFGNLVEDQKKGININLKEAETGNDCRFIISRGKNKNIRIEINGEKVGKKLQSIDSPYCIYVPGLAGIQNTEDYRPPSYVRKAAARGDANSVFRNILYLLKKDAESWAQFLSDFQTIFPDLSVDVEYDIDNEESINAFIRKKGHSKLPIDAAGTGVLQAIQILSYVNLYQPKVLLLDEPDAHLHPNNQRILAGLLVHIVENRSLQIMMCTHSRHLLDELKDQAEIHWVKDGILIEEKNPNFVSILMELGALDVGDRLRQGEIKCVILTEDENISPIKALCESSGFHMNETEIWSYKGCSRKDVILTLSAFIRQHAPASKIIIHRDRDYFTDEEIQKYKEDIQNETLFCFITEGNDTESHFISSDHIHELYPNITPELIERFIETATDEAKEKSIEKFTNARCEIKRLEGYKTGSQINIGAIAREVRECYEMNPLKYRHGKKVIGPLKAKLQEELKNNVNLFQATNSVKNIELEQISTRIWL